MKLRKVTKLDALALVDIYKKAALTPEGIARKAEEISNELIDDFLVNSLESGLAFVIENEEKIIAEIHCYRNQPKCFKHTLSNLVLVVDPAFHGQGLGRKIFTHLLEEVKKNHSDILRIELFTRQKNLRGIALYESLGFEIEGILKNRILDSDGNLSDDTMMAWFNPNFGKSKS